MEPEFLPCPTCRAHTLVEIPPCLDAHDGDGCPERVCIECGTALTLGDCAGSLISVSTQTVRGHGPARIRSRSAA